MEYWIGQIIAGGWNYAPRQTTLCHGQLLSIAEYSAVFALLNTNFGGDGRSTFGVPDLRGRSPVGTGHGVGLQPIYLGEKAGTNTVSLTANNLPPHNHTAVATTTVTQTPQNDCVTDEGENDEKSPSGNVLAAVETEIYSSSDPNGMMRDTNPNLSAQTTVEIGMTGVGSPFYIQGPVLGITYVIVLDGLFPPRT